MIYNCIIVDDESTARNILKRYISEIEYLNLIAECKNAIEATQILKDHNIDIIFLDIEMPKLSGLDFLKTLSITPNIIITTAYREYAIDGYEFDVKDYLLKPISFDRFIKGINKIISSRDAAEINANKEFTYFKSGKKNIQAYYNDILFIEGLSNYVKIITVNGTIVTYEKLSELEKILPKNKFIRIHRSYIVAINKINAYGKDFIEIDKNQLSIGNTYRESFINKLSKLSKNGNHMSNE